MAKKVEDIGSGAWGVEITSRNPFIERRWFTSQAKRDAHYDMMAQAKEHGSLENVTFSKINRVM